MILTSTKYYMLVILVSFCFSNIPNSSKCSCTASPICLICVLTCLHFYLFGQTNFLRGTLPCIVQCGRSSFVFVACLAANLEHCKWQSGGSLSGGNPMAVLWTCIRCTYMAILLHFT